MLQLGAVVNLARTANTFIYFLAFSKHDSNYLFRIQSCPWHDTTAVHCVKENPWRNSKNSAKIQSSKIASNNKKQHSTYKRHSCIALGRHLYSTQKSPYCTIHFFLLLLLLLLLLALFHPHYIVAYIFPLPYLPIPFFFFWFAIIKNELFSFFYLSLLLWIVVVQ